MAALARSLTCALAESRVSELEKYICFVRSLCLFFAIQLCAQPLPDSLWCIQDPNDTSLLVTYQVRSWGWAATTYRADNGSWRLLGVDTLFLDEQLRPISHVRYLDTAAASAATSLAPFEKATFAYPSAGESIFTTYDYDIAQEQYLPRRRVYSWNAAQRWDSVLSGQFGILGLDWNFYSGERIWPFPALIHAQHWGDSVLVEDFDPSATVFVEAGGYFFAGLAGGCDSLPLYEPPRAAPQVIGYYKRCYGAGGRLEVQADSFCTPIECLAQKRTLLYNSSGALERDSLHIRFYTPQGGGLGDISWVRKYLWNSQGQLSQAEYPGGRYVLRYGSQVVALSAARGPSKPELRFWGTGGQIKGASSRELVLLYDLLGRGVASVSLDEEGYFTLPEGLPPGIYVLRQAEHSWRVAVGL